MVGLGTSQQAGEACVCKSPSWPLEYRSRATEFPASTGCRVRRPPGKVSCFGLCHPISWPAKRGSRSSLLGTWGRESLVAAHCLYQQGGSSGSSEINRRGQHPTPSLTASGLRHSLPLFPSVLHTAPSSIKGSHGGACSS